MFYLHVQEIGIIHKVPRTATIVSRENVECLVIPSDVCEKVFPEEIERDYQYRLAYMRYVNKHVYMLVCMYVYTVQIKFMNLLCTTKISLSYTAVQSWIMNFKVSV